MIITKALISETDQICDIPKDMPQASPSSSCQTSQLKRLIASQLASGSVTKLGRGPLRLSVIVNMKGASHSCRGRGREKRDFPCEPFSCGGERKKRTTTNLKLSLSQIWHCGQLLSLGFCGRLRFGRKVQEANKHRARMQLAHHICRKSKQTPRKKRTRPHTDIHDEPLLDSNFRKWTKLKGAAFLQSKRVNCATQSKL